MFELIVKHYLKKSELASIMANDYLLYWLNMGEPTWKLLTWGLVHPCDLAHVLQMFSILAVFELNVFLMLVKMCA